MGSIVLNPTGYEWQVVKEKGKFKGIDLTYQGRVDRNKVFKAFASIIRKYGLEPEIRNMNAYILGAPIRVRDTPLKRFEEEYGYDHTNVTYLNILGKRPSLKAKLLGRVPPYVWLTVGYANMMELSTSDIDVSTSLEILDALSEQLHLGIPTGLIKSDIDFLRNEQA